MRCPLAPALLVTAALALAPAAALAQSAGDDQYRDPFEGGSGGQQQEQPTDQPAPEPAPAPAPEPAPGGDGEAETAAPAVDALPRTGGPVALIAGLGAALAGAGLAVRRLLR